MKKTEVTQTAGKQRVKYEARGERSGASSEKHILLTVHLLWGGKSGVLRGQEDRALVLTSQLRLQCLRFFPPNEEVELHHL